MAAQAAAWSLTLTHCLLCDELQHEIFLQVAMETLLFSSAPPASKQHNGLFLTLSLPIACKCCILTTSFFLSQLHPKHICVILDSSLFFLSLPKPFQTFGSEVSREVYKIQLWRLQEFLIEHEPSRKSKLIRIFHVIISHFVLPRQNTRKHIGRHQLS